MSKIKERRRIVDAIPRDRCKTVNATLFFSILTTIMLAILTLINSNTMQHVERINKMIDQNFVFITEIRDTLLAHVGWHKGRGDDL